MDYIFSTNLHVTTSQHCMYTLLHNPICTPTSVFCRRTVAATACNSVNNTESYICANTCLFLTEASSHIQQVVIIFLFYDASARLLSYASLGCLCPEMSAAWRAGQEAFCEQWSVAVPLCRHQPFDSVSAFSRPLCFHCLFDVTLAERDRHHWVVGVLFCCVPFTPAVERTESNTTRVGHCLPVELITLMAPP